MAIYAGDQEVATNQVAIFAGDQEVALHAGGPTGSEVIWTEEALLIWRKKQVHSDKKKTSALENSC